MRGIVRRLLVFLAVGVAAAAVWGAVEGGRYLQHEDPLQKADALFVLAGTRLERPLEALDLYREGYAPVILLSPGTQEYAERVASARGISIHMEGELLRETLVRAGVPASAIIIGDGPVDSTAGEAVMLKRIIAQRHWRSIIVITSKYHTRRTRFAMRRALEGTGVTIVVRASRYDTFDPAHWWRRRADVRNALWEWQKLIAYELGLAD